MITTIIKTCFICFAFTSFSCVVKEQVVQSQSNSNANVEQNTNAQNSSNANLAEDKTVDYFAHIKPEHR